MGTVYGREPWQEAQEDEACGWHAIALHHLQWEGCHPQGTGRMPCSAGVADTACETEEGKRKVESSL